MDTIQEAVKYYEEGCASEGLRYEAWDKMDALRHQYFAAHEEILRKSYDFSVGPGWWPILRSLFESIEAVMATPSSKGFEYQFVQIKEKFGGLRAYGQFFHPKNNPSIDSWDEEEWLASGNKTISISVGTIVSSFVSDAEQKCALRCECCGKPGTRGGSGWIKTYCEEHHEMIRGIEEARRVTRASRTQKSTSSLAKAA